MDNGDVVSVIHHLGRPVLESLARALEGQRLSPPFSPAGLKRHVSQDLAGPVCAELEQMSRLGMSPVHMAHLLRVLARERTSSQAIADRVELVWTGAEVAGTMSRDTFVVAQELFSQARRHLLVSSYNVDTGPKAETMFGDLARRMDQRPDLQVQLFLNVQRQREDQRPAEVLLREYAETFRRQVWPGKRLPGVYHDPRSLDLEWKERACLHAKVIVADDKRALVTSANLSEAAHERNIEAGLAIEDTHVAKALRLQFDALVERRILLPVPGL